jgi:hypothetical protein
MIKAVENREYTANIADIDIEFSVIGILFIGYCFGFRYSDFELTTGDHQGQLADPSKGYRLSLCVLFIIGILCRRFLRT